MTAPIKNFSENALFTNASYIFEHINYSHIFINNNYFAAKLLLHATFFGWIKMRLLLIIVCVFFFFGLDFAFAGAEFEAVLFTFFFLSSFLRGI